MNTHQIDGFTAVAESCVGCRAWWSVLGLLAPLSALGGPCLDVAVVMDGAPTIADELFATGLFESVDRMGFNGYMATDNRHDAIFVFYRGLVQGIGERSPFEERMLHGIRYEDYLESGGAIVMPRGAFGSQSGPLGGFRDIRMPLQANSSCTYGTPLVGYSPDSEHPVYYGIENLSLHAATRMTCANWMVHPDATVHASWPNGHPLMVSLGGVVAVNVWGESDNAPRVGNTGYPAESDITMLFANALIYAAGLSPATACNGDYDDDGLLDEDEERFGTQVENSDTDADGVLDGLDNCPLAANLAQLDADYDGLGDVCDEVYDEDIDDDGIATVEDNCPNVVNPEQADTDGNGIGDVCDDNGDGVLDSGNSCSDTPNADQFDGNGRGDVCEDEQGCSTVPGAPVLVAVLLPFAIRRRRWSSE